MSTPKRSIVVTRDYRPTPDNCARALALLLRKSLSKKADKPAPEPAGRDDAKESNGCIAYSNHNK
jgi:hypothetical protein